MLIQVLLIHHVYVIYFARNVLKWPKAGQNSSIIMCVAWVPLTNSKTQP